MEIGFWAECALGVSIGRNVLFFGGIEEGSILFEHEIGIDSPFDIGFERSVLWRWDWWTKNIIDITYTS